MATSTRTSTKSGKKRGPKPKLGKKEDIWVSTARLPRKLGEAVDSITSTRQGNEKVQTKNDALRYLISLGVKRLHQDDVPEKWPQPVAVKVVTGICCGTPAALNDYLRNADMPTRDITEMEILSKITPNAFIGVADGWSMCQGSYPDSISDGDELLFIPIDEWHKKIAAGFATWPRNSRRRDASSFQCLRR